ncbi:MAG: hypothetical protein ACYSW4_04875, partial [Planctomycetota bacterium]
MCRKLIFVTSVLLVLGLVNVASSADIDWEGPGTDWCNADNWSGAVPEFGDTAWLDGTPSVGPVIGGGCDANVSGLNGPCWIEHGAPSGTTQNINITGGTLAVHGNWWMEDWDDKHGNATVTVNISGDSVVKVEGLWHGQGGPDSNTVINISDNADVYVRDTIYAAGDAGSWFEFSMSGGDVNCGGIEARADGSGRFSITDGNLICRGDMEIRANNGTAEFTLDGGADVNVTGNFGFPADGDGNGVVYLNSGTLICGSFGPDGNDWSLDIDAGVTWLIKGSHAATIQSHIDADRITGKDGAEPPLVVEFLVGEQTWTQVGFDLVQLNAYNPSPTDGNSNICPGGGLTLTWDAGIIVQDTNAHEVFFGKSWADVNSMTDPCAIKNVGDETYDTGPLEYGQSYYWRVDEVNDVNIADPCTWRGPIWHFSTYSGRAREESPPSGRRGLPPGDIDLSWGEFPCQRLTVQTLYYGTDFPQSIVLFDDDF